MSRTEEELCYILSGWQSWNVASGDIKPIKQPTVVKELFGGRTNRSFLVETASQLFVVRINAKKGKSLGINRQREADILSRLQPLNCVPKIRFISERTLVSDYIPGRSWQPEDMTNKNNQKKIVHLLNTIQSVVLPKSIIRRNYVEYCQQYIEQLPADIKQSESYFIEALNSAASAVDQAAWATVISHHDLVPENIVESTQGLFLLDWEYAAYSHPAIDFVRLYGAKYSSPCCSPSFTEKLLIVQQGIDKLWCQVQVHRSAS